MSGEYRDELGAAHSRIAELEEKVRTLEEEVRSPSRAPADGRFPELEAKVARLRKAADPTANARGRTQLSLISAVFPLIGMVLTYFHQPIAATMCSVVFIAIVAANIYIGHHLKVEMRFLAEAEAKLADARRIVELEAKLADTRVRIAAAAETAPPTAPPTAEAEAEADSERGEAAAQPLR